MWSPGERRATLPPRGPHGFHLHVDGGDFIPAMLDAIDSASHYVLLEMYLIRSGRIAERFIAALAGAARRGVAVHLLLDGFGAQGLESQDRARLTDAQVHVAVYNPIGLRRWRVSLFRNHRKLLVVDGRIAFVGGMGIADEFDPGAREDRPHWHETMLSLTGPCIADWQRLFVDCWRAWSTQPILLPRVLAPESRDADRTDGRVLGDVRSGGRAVMRGVLAEIGKARGRVWLATAYFAPTRRLQRALKKAVRRGVDVRLLLAGPCNDHPTVWHAGRRFYGRLLRGGVRIFEYQPGFLHAKMVLCDDWATIGSSNLDHWALRWNLEANQAVMHPPFASHVETVFRADFAQSTEWTAGGWQQRGYGQRALERVLGAGADWLVQWSYRRALRRPGPP